MQSALGCVLVAPIRRAVATILPTAPLLLACERALKNVDGVAGG